MHHHSRHHRLGQSEDPRVLTYVQPGSPGGTHIDIGMKMTGARSRRDERSATPGESDEGGWRGDGPTIKFVCREDDDDDDDDDEMTMMSVMIVMLMVLMMIRLSLQSHKQ